MPPELRQQLLDHYLDALAGFVDVKREAFMQHYYAYVYIRIMQALGAYGFRGFYERKAHFLQSVPYALKNLRWLLHNVTLPIALPTLLEAFHSMLGSEKLQGLASDADNLVVRIFSFSFHRGLPKDESGNGGGFVFDGRSLPNPGREERFKTLTGRDAPVIDYLNQQESVHQFLASVMSLVDASVSELSAARLQEPDGVIRMHRRPAPFRLSGRASGETPARRNRRRSRPAASRTGKNGAGERPSGESREMKAMILAAGLGTRLRPLTNDRPKALVEVAGRTMLEITLRRLRAFGIREVIVNVHHFADMVVDYLKKNDNFGMRIEISREDVLLDTGGGLKKAAWFFLENGLPAIADEPFRSAQRRCAQHDRSGAHAAVSPRDAGAGYAGRARTARHLDTFCSTSIVNSVAGVSATEHLNWFEVHKRSTHGRSPESMSFRRACCR